jgi:hypothetical protein
MEKETKLKEREQLELQQRRLDGEFDRRRLIRFGYLSVAERRRLRETYHDLDERFEPETHSWPLQKAFNIFVVYMIGFMGGAVASERVTLIECVVAIGVYWIIALLVVRGHERIEGDRTELYWEWRGYRCDRHGRKI